MKNKLLRIFLKLSGKDIFTKYQDLKRLEFESLEDNLNLQNDKLIKLLIHAAKYVPYYSQVLRESGVVIDGQVNLEKFNKIPILTKEILRNEFDHLQSSDKNFKKRKPFLNTSGGSTGEPARFIQDKTTWVMGMACKWLFFSFLNPDFPCKLIKLWGSERDILKGSYGLKANIKNWLYNRQCLNSFRMAESQMYNYVKKINNFKPIIIETYVQSIFELSRFIKEKKLTVYSPRGIVTSAGTLYPEMKKEIEEVFQTKVYNRYGSREVGDIACSCDRDEGLHLNIFQHYVEILNDKLEPCDVGEIGKVYITRLDNFSMPLIRYDIGDLAVVARDKKCSCGRGLPLIERVEGRELSIIKTRDGKIISSTFFIHFIGVVYNQGYISKFQLIQKSYEKIVVKVVLLNKKGFDDNKDKIETAIKGVMGEDCEVDWDIVDRIEAKQNGKFLYTISEINTYDK